jgi:starvation-inducible DNA-binding protein
MELHELFDSTAGLSVGWSDEIAERVAQLGGLAEGSSRHVADRTTLPSIPLVADDASQWVNAVADSVGNFANNVREAIDAADAAGDQVTADLFTRIGSAADKQLWFVEAHLQGR